MKTYPLALDLWDDTRIATFPIEFVQRGGDNTWRFVLKIVQELLESQSGSLPVLKDLDGGLLDLNQAPWAGTFSFEHVG
jgi:hypothetical protein